MTIMTVAPQDEIIEYMDQLDLLGQAIVDRARVLFSELLDLPEDSAVATLNALRRELHKCSPFRTEPVDCIQWVSVERVQANDYNPNAVASPEMELLEHSIVSDGYTQPIVAWVRDDDICEVVDGFHRNRVGRESKVVSKRIKGFLPLTIINQEREDRGDRIAATIRHNRARGKHQIEGMSEIVVELKRRNWSDKKIGKELGMDPDEVLRLSQISGLAEMFADREFSEAWEAVQINEDDNLEVPAEEEHKPLPQRRLEPGWHDRTDNRSVLIGENQQELARLNRPSSWKEQWSWTVYTAPMQTGIAEDRESARCAAEAALKL